MSNLLTEKEKELYRCEACHQIIKWGELAVLTWRWKAYHEVCAMKLRIPVFRRAIER